MVDVARLGSPAGHPADVVAAELGREVADVVGPAVVEDPGAVLAGHRQCRGGRAPDRLDGLAVDGDEDVDDDLLAVEDQRPVRLGLAVTRHPDRVEEAVASRVVGVVARAGGAGQDRPHRQQRLGDQHRLGDDDHRVRQPVAAVVRVEQERRVEQDAQRSDDGQQDHDRGVGGRAARSPVGQDLDVAPGQVMGRVEGQHGTPVPNDRGVAVTLRATGVDSGRVASGGCGKPH